MIHIPTKSLIRFFVLYICTTNLFSQTDIAGGPVYGLWTFEKSPYRIADNIEIPVDSTLTIEPGVVVEFQGFYSLNVQGRLLAVGTEDDSITFTVSDTSGFSNPDTSLGGWNGIRIIDPSQDNDSTKIEFCRLEFGKAFGSVWHLNAGGAICITQFDKVQISNCLFENNRAVSSSEHLPIGGALYFFRSDIVIKDNTFINNNAHSGGAVFFDESDAQFSNNIFRNNFAVAGGAVGIGSTSYPTFINDRFLNNIAKDHGGGLVFSQPSVVICSNIMVSGNKAVWGAGIGVQGGELQASDCQFLGNRAELWGGGVAGDYATLYLNNCLFTQDTSDWGSGALHMDHAIAEIIECDFSENQAVFGGGFHSLYSQVFVSETYIGNNRADAAAGAHLENSDLEMNLCLFEANQATIDRAGAIDYVVDTTIFLRPNILNLTGCLFLGNEAASNTGGLRIEQTDTTQSLIDISIKNCDFLDNKADIYAGLRIEGHVTGFEVANCLFKNNSSKRWVGGAGFISNSQGRVYNSLFAANYSSYSDSSKNAHGASLGSRAEVDFFNCTFTDTSNAGGVGISLRRGGKARITNSILWGCGNRPLSLIAVAGLGCSVEINHCDILNGRDSVFVSDTLSTVIWGEGNISYNPLFVDMQNMDFRLQDNSPCIGAGINCIMINEEWHCAPTADIEDNPRPNPQGSFADIGAYENALGGAVSIENLAGNNPEEFRLFQNYPNPFNNSTMINYQLPVRANHYLHVRVELSIYNILGQKVATLVNKKQAAGSYQVQWDASGFASGIYYYKLDVGDSPGRTGDYQKIKKMILIK